MSRLELDMQRIGLMNLFTKTTRVKARHCFSYNSSLIFVIQNKFVSKAIGKSGRNVKMLGMKLKKKIKIISLPGSTSQEAIETFTRAIVHPVTFRQLTLTNNELQIKAGPQDKALLIGREHSRLAELNDILKRYFEIKRVRIL